MHVPKIIGLTAGAFLLTAPALHAGTNYFGRQMLTLPSDTGTAHFADVDGNGRPALLAVAPVARQLWVFRQRDWGFTNAPDQILLLPPQTGWIALCDVDEHPGLELLMSTATGLVYCRQNKGQFETELHTLIRADQVFTNDVFPMLIPGITNGSLPVISATQLVRYQREGAFEWHAGQAASLGVTRATWRPSGNEWSLGAKASRGLRVEVAVREKPDEEGNEKPENDGIRKLIEDMKKAAQHKRLGTNRVDLNGDGRTDLVLWHVLGDREIRTDVYVFLRGTDGRLPERPTQVLHCRGLPIPIGCTYDATPIGALRGDGTYQLVLLETKLEITSASSLVEALLSRGLDWALTIRTFHDGVFSTSPDGSLALTALLPGEILRQWPIFLSGDFNADGRPDLVVQRSTSHWNVFLSTTNSAHGEWFVPEPAMTFETPLPGFATLADLNGDGCSDIFLRAFDEPRMYIFLSHSQYTKGTQP